jgi:hypothetical protein
LPDGYGVGPTGSSGVEAATRSHLVVHNGELEGAPQGCCGDDGSGARQEARCGKGFGELYSAGSRICEMCGRAA